MNIISNCASKISEHKTSIKQKKNNVAKIQKDKVNFMATNASRTIKFEEGALG